MKMPFYSPAPSYMQRVTVWEESLYTLCTRSVNGFQGSEFFNLQVTECCVFIHVWENKFVHLLLQLFIVLYWNWCCKDDVEFCFAMLFVRIFRF